MSAKRGPDGKFAPNPNSKRQRKKKQDNKPAFSPTRVVVPNKRKGPTVTNPLTTATPQDATASPAWLSWETPPQPTVADGDHGPAVETTAHGTADGTDGGDGGVAPVGTASAEAAPVLDMFNPTPGLDTLLDDGGDNEDTPTPTNTANPSSAKPASDKVAISPADSGDMIAMMATAVWGVYVQFRHPYVSKLTAEQQELFEISEKDTKGIAKAGALWAKHSKIEVSPEANLAIAIGKALGPKLYMAEAFRPQLMASVK